MVVLLVAGAWIGGVVLCVNVSAWLAAAGVFRVEGLKLLFDEGLYLVCIK